MSGKRIPTLAAGGNHIFRVNPLTRAYYAQPEPSLSTTRPPPQRCGGSILRV